MTTTQIGPDGYRYPIGEVPEGYEPPSTLNVLNQLQAADIQWHRQSTADMLAGTGIEDGGTAVVGAGFIIPDSWPYVRVDIMWAKLDDFTTPGDVTLGARLTWYSDGEAFGDPYFGGRSSGGAYVPSSTITTDVLNVTNVVEADPCQGALLTVEYGRIETLNATGSRAAELEALDTASIAQGQAGIFAVVVYPPVANGASWDGHTWRGRTWR